MRVVFSRVAIVSANELPSGSTNAFPNYFGIFFGNTAFGMFFGKAEGKQGSSSPPVRGVRVENLHIVSDCAKRGAITVSHPRPQICYSRCLFSHPLIPKCACEKISAEHHFEWRAYPCYGQQFARVRTHRPAGSNAFGNELKRGLGLKKHPGTVTAVGT
eukprot:6775574-Pyramimonas_sp.AAC.1